jgi:hypothetical protein
MLPMHASKPSSAAAMRTTRDRLVDAGFHASVVLLAAAIVLIAVYAG